MAYNPVLVECQGRLNRRCRLQTTPDSHDNYFGCFSINVDNLIVIAITISVFISCLRYNYINVSHEFKNAVH